MLKLNMNVLRVSGSGIRTMATRTCIFPPTNPGCRLIMINSSKVSFVQQSPFSIEYLSQT